MAQQGKQVRAGAGECFSHHSVNLGLLAYSSRYEIESSTYVFSIYLYVTY